MTFAYYFRPGNIRLGKRQMVRKVEKYHMRQMEQDIEREKKNMFYCMNPAVTVVSYP